MMDLEEFYKSVGSDIDDVVGRLGGSRSLVKRFLKKFLDDKNFSNLLLALEEEDAKSAFKAARTLQGVADSLGMKTLFVEASKTARLLWEENLEEAKKALPDLEEEYLRIRYLLEDLA